MCPRSGRFVGIMFSLLPMRRRGVCAVTHTTPSCRKHKLIKCERHAVQASGKNKDAKHTKTMKWFSMYMHAYFHVCMHKSGPTAAIGVRAYIRLSVSGLRLGVSSFHLCSMSVAILAQAISDTVPHLSSVLRRT